MLNILRGPLRQGAFSQLRQASFTVRELLQERSDENGTLLNRFCKHVAIEGSRIGPAVLLKVRYADYFPVSDIRYFNQQLSRTSADQIPSILTFAFTYRPSADPGKFVQVLNIADTIAVRLLPEMDNPTILGTLYAWLFLIPNWITRTDFYRAALEHFTLTTDSHKEEFVQLCFYLGLGKKQIEANILSNVLAKHLDRHLSKMSIMDFAIVANAAYKMSFEVQSDKFNAELQRRIMSLNLRNENIALLITFLKSMRLQRISSTTVCKHISTLCTNGDALRILEPRALSHILAFYAENLWDDPCSTRQLQQDFITHIRDNKSSMNAHYEKTVRPKDIATFLWSTAHLNCSFTNNELREIEACLLGMVYKHEFDNFPDQLVDCCLSLWILGYKSQDLLQAAVVAKRELGPNLSKPKIENRLRVLLSAVAIEKPTWKVHQISSPAFNLKAEVPSYLKKQRPDIVKCAHLLSELDDIINVKIISPIKGINILGLHIQLKTSDDRSEKNVFLELTTEKQILKFSKVTTSLIRLKISLLKSLGYNTVVEKSNELTAEDILKLHGKILGIVSADVAETEQNAMELMHSV